MNYARIPAWRWWPFWGYSPDAPYRHVVHVGWWLLFFGINGKHPRFAARPTAPGTGEGE